MTTGSPDATAEEPPPPPPAVEQAAVSRPASSGPYVHPVELVVEGNYLDVLAYLHALENLPWRFYWKILELQTTHYPTNRVRIELSTLSMDKDWIGV
jgi:MSHA biogenesis protein MshJ